MSTDDEESMGDMWRAIKAERQEKRASNRTSSAELLREAGILFTAKNGDAHLIVRTAGGNTVDFWPGTGLGSFVDRSNDMEVCESSSTYASHRAP